MPKPEHPLRARADEEPGLGTMRATTQTEATPGGAEALAWLAAIVESADEAIISKRLDGIVTSWNPAARRIFGWEPFEMVGQSILKIIPPELQPEEQDIIGRIRRGERVDHFETTRMRKDGSRFRVSLTISPVRDATGRIIGASKIARDLTGVRESETARAYLAAIIDSSDDAIISKDLNGIVTSWNHSAERLYGYSAEEMVGQPVLKIIPPELSHEEEFILSKVRAGEKIDHYETVRMHRNGQRLQVSLTVSPIRDSRGRIVGASKIARDIGLLLRAERAQGLLGAIVLSSDDAIISKDLDGVVTSWNPAAERLYGYGAEEMIGTPIRRIIPEDLQGEEDLILAKIRAGERIEHFETVRYRKDGSRVEVSITVSPVRDARGRIVGASKVARDITAQRQAQRKKDQFLAVLAHELRNPLAPVRNAISLFRVPGLSEEQRDRAQSIAERQIEHMARLLDDLLDVSRISTGRVELKRAVVELRPLVANAVDATRGLMEARRHRLRIDQAREPMWLDADAVRITQIFTNLLSNAAKYTDDGGDIVLTTRSEDGFAVVSVRDTGIGFAPAMRERLFTLFAQEEKALGRAAGGLGIGLALVREFVERHGGTVSANSAGPGQGSEFVVRLPTIAAPAGG